VKNNDNIDVGENIFTQKNYSEFSENRDDDSFNIDNINNIIPNSFCDKSNYNFLYNINFIGYMPFENKLKSNEAKESQETLNIKKISEMEKEKQLVMKEQELIEKEKELIEKETALNMKEKEMRENEEKLRKEKELIEKEKALNMKEKELIEKERNALNMEKKELIKKETALNMEEKEKREKIQQEFREKEILKKEEKKI
jgi:hypothetical protein